MIKPYAQSDDWLNFVCDKDDCGARFHIGTISHDAATTNDAQKYDIRNWIIMKIHLQCPTCGDQGEFKLSLRDDLVEPIS